MNAISFALLLFVIAFVQGQRRSRTEILRNETGDISYLPGGRISYKIIAPKGHHIIIQVNELRLNNRRSSFTLRERKNGRRYKYNSRNPPNLPLKFETKSSNLIIQFFGETGDGFSAHYTSYTTGNCWKKHVYRPSEGDGISCNSDDLSPVAKTCVVTIPCERNHKQYSKQTTCNEDEEWEGNVGCFPDKDLLEKNCSLNFEDFMINNECPFAAKEIANYYISVEGANPYDITVSRSSSQRRVSCNEVCPTDATGRYLVRCPNRKTKKNRDRYAKCVICRLYLNCRKRSFFD